MVRGSVETTEEVDGAGVEVDRGEEVSDVRANTSCR
jgi:hypothetical protein